MLVLACGDDGGGPDEPANGMPPADADAIRDEDLGGQAEVQAALTKLGGGTIAETEIAYADLTNDQREEAIVPITSGGTMGNISYLIFTMDDGGASLLLTRTMTPSDPGGVNMYVEGGKLVEYVAEYGPEDPFCCPSFLRKTTFTWNGTKLVPEEPERVPAGMRKQ